MNNSQVPILDVLHPKLPLDKWNVRVLPNEHRPNFWQRLSLDILLLTPQPPLRCQVFDCAQKLEKAASAAKISCENFLWTFIPEAGSSNTRPRKILLRKAAISSMPSRGWEPAASWVSVVVKIRRQIPEEEIATVKHLTFFQISCIIFIEGRRW